MGTSVKDLMKSSSSTAPALSLDTTKTEQGVNKCWQTHTQACVSSVIPGHNVHQSHFSGGWISLKTTPFTTICWSWRKIEENVGVSGSGRHGEQEIFGINMSTIISSYYPSYLHPVQLNILSSWENTCQLLFSLCIQAFQPVYHLPK